MNIKHFMSCIALPIVLLLVFVSFFSCENSGLTNESDSSDEEHYSSSDPSSPSEETDSFEETDFVTDEISDGNEEMISENKLYASSDNGDGTFNNPVIYADVPDPDVISVVGEDGKRIYYMVSTTMHMSPGACIMRSYDLVNWTVVSYAYDIMADVDALNLENGEEAYAGGSWAASLRYFRGKFYVLFCSYTTWDSYICITDDIENGDWEMIVIDDLYYDPSLFFEEQDDGSYRVFVVHGMKNIKLTELDPDLTGKLKGTHTETIIENAGRAYSDENEGAEGSHIYKIGDYYYVFLITWPSGTVRTELCYRSEDLYGPYEGRVVYNGICDMKNVGVAQGGLIETDNGYDHAMLFEDHSAVGRTPVLMKVTWEDGWPVFDTAETVSEKPIDGYGISGIVSDDDFENGLSICWQWNHNPDNELWKIENGKLIFTTDTTVPSLVHAKNTLTQRTFGSECSGEILIDVSQMKNGDVAGLSAFLSKYSYIGIHMKDNEKYLVVAKNNGDVDEEDIEYKSAIKLKADTIHLRMAVNYEKERKVYFFYSYDGEEWYRLADEQKISYDLDMFVGCRFAIFYYSTLTSGGNVSVEYFDVEDDSEIISLAKEDESEAKFTDIFNGN